MANAERITYEPDSPWVFTLADRLDKALKVSGVSVAEMAEALDVSRNTISNYTSGRTKPSRLQVKEWAARTGAPRAWLETGVGPAGIEPTTSTVEAGRFGELLQFRPRKQQHPEMNQLGA